MLAAGAVLDAWSGVWLDDDGILGPPHSVWFCAEVQCGAQVRNHKKTTNVISIGIHLAWAELPYKLISQTLAIEPVQPSERPDDRGMSVNANIDFVNALCFISPGQNFGHTMGAFHEKVYAFTRILFQLCVYFAFMKKT